MTGKTVAVKDTPPAEQTPQQMIMHALSTGASVETMERLLALQNQWEDRQARKAFFKALGDFQAMQPSITRLKQVSFNDTQYFYAPLGDIAEQIREALHANGLSYRFEQDHTEGISVTCIVSHIAGWEEETTMRAVADASGKKNAVQAIGSTVTYLQRYSLISALGITTADSDMDARLSGETITDEQAASLKTRLEASGSNVKAFCKMLGIDNVDAMPTAKYAQADRELSRKEAQGAAQ